MRRIRNCESQRLRSWHGPVIAAMAIALLATSSTSNADAPRRTAYVHTNLVDTTRGQIIPDVAIVVAEGHIESVTPMAAYQSGTRSITLDLRGRYVIPGLVNSHVHLATSAVPRVARSYLRRELLSGVTAVRDMAGDVRLLSELKREAEFDEIPAPDIYYAALFAGPEFFIDPRSHEASRGRTAGQVPWMQAVNAQSDLRLAIARAVGTGATGIKLYGDLPASLVEALAAEAHRQHLLVWAHAAIFPAKPSEIAKAAVDVMSHACLLGYEVSEPPLATNEDSRHVEGDKVTHPNSAIDAVLSEMRQRGIILDATLWPYETRNVKSCTPDESDYLAKAAVRAGIPISTGTDDDWDPALGHSNLPTEIELLVSKAGMSPADVLKSATVIGAQTIGESAHMGTVEPGKLANFVVLTGNPLENLGNLRKVTLVVKHGISYRVNAGTKSRR